MTRVNRCPWARNRCIPPRPRSRVSYIPCPPTRTSHARFLPKLEWPHPATSTEATPDSKFRNIFSGCGDAVCAAVNWSIILTQIWPSLRPHFKPLRTACSGRSGTWCSPILRVLSGCYSVGMLFYSVGFLPLAACWCAARWNAHWGDVHIRRGLARPNEARWGPTNRQPHLRMRAPILIIWGTGRAYFKALEG